MISWFVLGFLGCAALLAGGFLAYVLIRYMPIIVNLFEEVQPPPATNHRLDGEEVKFRASDGTPLSGVFVRGGSGNGKTIVFCHEYGSDMHSIEKYGRFLMDEGFNIFVFDFRGHGASGETNGYVPRQWVTDKEVKDLLGAIDYLKTRADIDSSRLGLFGISRGAGSSICVASQCDSVRAVVADGAFSTALTLERYMKKWVSIFAGVRLIHRNLPHWFYAMLGYICCKVAQRRLKCKFPPVERCARRLAPKPLYLIYGEKDKYVGLSQAKELFGCACDPKELWIVPGARHNESASVAADEYAKKVTNFFKKSL